MTDLTLTECQEYIDNEGTAEALGYPSSDPWLAASILGWVNSLKTAEEKQRRIRIIRELLAAVAN